MVAGEEAGLTVGLTSIAMDCVLLHNSHSPGGRGSREEDSILPGPVTGPGLGPPPADLLLHLLRCDHEPGRGDGLGTPRLTS